MNLKSFIKRLFGGEAIGRFYSPVNGEILVVKELSGKTVMRVGGITQSGGMVEGLWERVLSQITNYKLQTTNCLILGLGCGTVAKILAKEFPGVKLTGIEIDPKVIEIGKKYFNLDKFPNLRIIVKDAISLVKDPKFIAQNSKFNLILVDLYCGQEFPKEAESKEFLNRLKKILVPNGLIIFNRLNFGGHKIKTAEFVEKLKNCFSKVSLQKTGFNLFIFAAE